MRNRVALQAEDHTIELGDRESGSLDAAGYVGPLLIMVAVPALVLARGARGARGYTVR